MDKVSMAATAAAIHKAGALRFGDEFHLLLENLERLWRGEGVKNQIV